MNEKMRMNKMTTKKPIARKPMTGKQKAKPEPTPNSDVLKDRFKRDRLAAIDNRSLLETKRDTILANAQAEADLVQADIDDADKCIGIFDGALAGAVHKDNKPNEIPTFLKQPGNVLKMAGEGVN